MVNEEIMKDSYQNRVVLERIIDSKNLISEEPSKKQNGHEMVYYPLRYTSLVHRGLMKEQLERHGSINKLMDNIRLNERNLSR